MAGLASHGGAASSSSFELHDTIGKLALLAPRRCEKREEGTHGSVRALEAVDLLCGLGELLLRCECFQHLKHVLPEGLVVLVEEDNETGGLGVE